MPGPARIEPRFHGPENILTGGAGNETAISLEEGVAITAGAGSGDVGAVVVRLPDLDEGAADGRAVLIEHAAAHPGDGSDCGRDGVVDDDQIVVEIERQFIGI